ncbi:RagB/SusD family nutrient uptake outer membrane protein [Chitinophaga ginsengisegetis]|uniref:RagB/SusD family nutrient uptake outer membrane protein n=1 Tax=Chitinophaga ginsengisegetis TaxID=393003 RepID=UPI00341A148D
MHFNHIFNSRFLIVILGVILTSSCKKLVDVDSPITSITGKNVYDNNATSIAVLSGIYTTMSQNSIQGGGTDLTSVGFITGLMSDELSLYIGTMNPILTAYYQNSMSSRLQEASFWNSIYKRLYIVNSAIEGLSKQNALTEKIKVQLLGEAKFIRALCYFYLVNLYGDVPLVTTTDYKLNMSLSRISKDKIWSQIILDLKDSQNLLSPNYLDATLLKKTNERVRPNKWAATALLARVYLYLQDWENAEIQATNIINETSLYSLTPLDEKFKKNNTETIWGLQPVLRGWNTEDAKAYIIPIEFGPNAAAGAFISNQLLNSFEPGDLRKNKWIDSISFEGITYPFAFKYQLNTLGDDVNEYNIVLRLSEQFLIRAEAKAWLGNLAGARDDLKMIRERAGLENTSATTKDALLSAILHERQVELFTEWGHRWFDLKRTDNVNSVMSQITPLKGGAWSANWQWLPIPLYDLQANTNIQQNNGY